jgi:hypothetical protein
VITCGQSLGEAGADPSQARARRAGPPVLTGRPVDLRTDEWLHKRATLRRRCREFRQKFYGERGILVAEGGSLILAREVPSVGASSWGFRFGGQDLAQ